MRHRDRVKVGEEEEAVAALRGGIVLHPHPVADRAQIIAEVQISGGLDARYDPHGLLLCRRRSVAGAPPREHGEQILVRSEEHTSELQSLMRISYAVFCLKKKTTTHILPQK